ncbi:hypothetical protein IUY40_00025 [Flavobacterium sp. ALJ2]|uniref:hypothetical protein n=1 Tax=Flavobacterium sp. ALJ2 TaxID=2786960 RepID=UPI00189F9EB0|nr:hypothetical protein [Flavobacterium sp. ALJ2]MBF7089936.1 hypothetical protein [Flavobacterium sp. ALJ2]
MLITPATARILSCGMLIKVKHSMIYYKPCSAGEDQLGGDISYIFGIWENPLLTDAIIAKIKNNEK